MTDYDDEHNKRLFAQSLPQILRIHEDDYDVYFVTFTFENTHSIVPKDAYLNFFKTFYQKLNQHSVNKCSKYPHRKALMILIPEASKECGAEHMHKPRHYHGFIILRKEDRSRFDRRCIKQNEDGRKIFQEALFKNSPPMLRVYSTDVKDAVSRTDKIKISGYSVKNFAKKKDYTGTTVGGCRISLHDYCDDTNGQFSYDSVLFFTPGAKSPFV